MRIPSHMQGYELISSLQSEDQQVRYIHYEEFSNVIVEVVGHYIEKVCQHIPAYDTDLGKMCMLLNNLHALRINIQDLFNVMGGEEVSSCLTIIIITSRGRERKGGREVHVHCKQLP